MKALARLLIITLCGVFVAGASAQTPPPQNAKSSYTIAQAISDRAQLNTIAFSGLAFLTGTFGSDTFLPPGKISDYFGFQYMRDVQPNGMGHNTDFLTRIADNMLFILTDAQKAQLIALAKSQDARVTALAYQRFPLIWAFNRQLNGKLPHGSSGLSRAAVMKYVSGIFELDGQLSYERAAVYGNILSNLSAD